MKDTSPTPLEKAPPAITVLVPTYGRPDRISALIDRLKAQTAPSASFEVVIVDDGGDPPARVDVRDLPFDCTVIQKKNGGPAAARNAGLAVVRAPLVLILNDDAVPSPELVQNHLLAHRETDGRTAVLGTFHFTERSRTSPLVRVLDESDQLFAFSGLEHGAALSWMYFWTCNVSLPMEALIAVGGFDEERFDAAICEDVELGFRLQNAGYSLTFSQDCVAHHEHIIAPREYADRAFQLGRYQTRLADKHGLESLFWGESEAARANLERNAVSIIEERRPAAEAFFEELVEHETKYQNAGMPSELASRVKKGLAEHSTPLRLAGLHFERTGVNALDIMDHGAPLGTSVSIVVVSLNALENTKNCIRSVRRAVDGRYNQEIIVVDNGSTDGSSEWLAAQDDLKVIQNPSNYGAPRARNQAIRHACKSHWIAFLDNDVIVPTGWLDRALYHGAVDPAVGSIALCANRASRRQVVEYSGPGTFDAIERFAVEHAEDSGRKGEDTTLFTSLAVLVRAEAIDQIGGFDESFSPWGFEDDDIALRIRLAGWRNRVARDTFVYHAPYDGQEKHELHGVWLQQNWNAFLQKWCPKAAGAKLFDYTNVAVPQLGEATPEQLVFELPGDDVPPPTWEGQERASAAAAPEPTTESSGESADAAGDAQEIRPMPPGGGSANAANVLVLGCGRSGTSMVTGMLAEAGWFVGDNPYPGRPANPKGFFETSEINGINECLLAATVRSEAPLRSMQHWLALAPEPLEFTVDAALRQRMDRLAARGPFAYKDPRFCYTLDAWRPSIGDAKHICIFREPSVTAASIVREVGKEDYLNGCGVDFDRAIDVWDAMYRRVLDQHAASGDWLFLHFDQLFTAEGMQRLEEFVGGPVAQSFPEKGLSQAASTAPVPAAAAETYRELCARAGVESSAIATLPATKVVRSVEAPELTVLICTYQRKNTLARCIRSFEQQTAAGRYEIIVVNDGATDGTKEMLEEWQPNAPFRVVHQENGGLSAARNAGLRVARGKYVLLVNDDTIASKELVAEHLSAHESRGPGHAVLGSFDQPRAALDNALMRVLEETTMVFCYAALDPNVLHDWNRFWTCNVSVSLDDVRSVGMFDESFRHYGAEDTDLAYRLEKECGTKVAYVPTARAEHEHILTFEDVKRRSRTVSSAYVRFFRKHPEAMGHPFWRYRSENSLARHEQMLIGVLAERSRAEAFAAELSAIDVGTIERAGPEGAEIARAITVRLKQYLAELNHLWWAEGECDGLRIFNKSAMAELRSQEPKRKEETAAA